MVRARPSDVKTPLVGGPDLLLVRMLSVELDLVVVLVLGRACPLPSSSQATLTAFPLSQDWH